MSKAHAHLLANRSKYEDAISKIAAKHREVASKILDFLAEKPLMSEDKVIRLSGTSVFDQALVLLIIEELDTKASCVIMHQMFGTSLLTNRNWINRLRTEGMCDIPWIKKEEKTKGNVGKFVVNDWGIFKREVYAPFAPYVKLLVEEAYSALSTDITERFNEYDG